MSASNSAVPHSSILLAHAMVQSIVVLSANRSLPLAPLFARLLRFSLASLLPLILFVLPSWLAPYASGTIGSSVYLRDLSP